MPAARRSLRIVHLITRFIPGGADENTLLSANWFAEHGHDVTLIYGDHVDARILDKVHPAVTQIQVDALCRAVRPHRDLMALFRIRRLLARLRSDILHTHTSKAGFIGRLATLGLPRIAVVHGVHILPFVNVGMVEKLVYTLMEKSVVPLTDAFVNVSEGMKATALAQGMGEAADHYVVPSGMDIDRFRRTDGQSPGDSSTDRTEILLLAAYEPRKQHLRLLEYLAAHKAEFAGRVRFHFAGHGHLGDECRSFVRKHGLEDIVDVGDFAPDPAALIRAADICIYCSTNEGLPRAVVQYAAAGKPVIALDLPGLDVIVKHGVNGYLCPQDDFAALCGHVLELTNDPELRARMAAASMSLDLSAWSVEHMCAELEAIYDHVLSRASVPQRREEAA